MSQQSILDFFLTLMFLITGALGLRLYQKIPYFHNVSIERKRSLKGQNLMVLLGSGGHTGEMFRLLSSISELSELGSINWCVSSGDTTSVVQLDNFLKKTNLTKFNSVIQLSRARKVGESWGSSIISTLKSFVSSLHSILSLKSYPDVLMVNGPGTAVPLCYLFLIMNVLGISNTKILYVESLARVNQLSLSGRLCYWISDRFLVQWPGLTTKYQRAEYHGILV
ncbi:hypothetical protein WICPIJ_010006 [Wickerhamomyces pijperi]|uniref:UDP-N-acetylglucosamine transferase subunit ALG14 n=1 Tax=Wickerhamomyces pijperi TaxID=599730 RepID=A0A9P8PJB5_WICPI|nr:hypothetical protein WICPIJ_010006 [Wickerhamomyces pijperi]